MVHSLAATTSSRSPWRENEHGREKKKEIERAAESLIVFLLLSFSCWISHDHGIRKKNLYDDNDSMLVRKDQPLYPITLFSS